MKKLAGLPIVLVMVSPQIGTAAEPGWGDYASIAIVSVLGDSSSSSKVKRGDDERAPQTLRIVRPGASEDINEVSLIKWNWNNTRVVLLYIALAAGLLLLLLLTQWLLWCRHGSAR